MGIFDTLKSALGLQRPIQPHAAGPVSLTKEAAGTVIALPDGVGIQVTTYAMGDGRVARFAESSDLPEGHTGPALLLNPSDRDHLRGLRIHHDGNAFHLTVDLSVQPKETPNPNGRLYITSRNWAVGPPQSFHGEGQHPPLVQRLLSIDGVVGVLLRDNTVSIERADETSWSTIDSQVSATLRTYLLRMGRPLTKREHSGHDGLAAAIAEVLEEQVAPMIRRDGGDIELLDVTDGVVQVRLTGACRTCPASTMTLKMGVEATLKEAFPEEVDRVEAL